MCTELFLAIVYFITIFVVNYFLYKLLKTYTTNIFYLSRLKTIFQNFDKKDVKSLAILYFYSKNNFRNTNLLTMLNKFSTSNDNIVIGKTYNYLANNLESKSQSQNSLIYYLRLMENQYLSKKGK
jgi:hypothetical protein